MYELFYNYYSEFPDGSCEKTDKFQLIFWVDFSTKAKWDQGYFNLIFNILEWDQQNYID